MQLSIPELIPQVRAGHCDEGLVAGPTLEPAPRLARGTGVELPTLSPVADGLSRYSFGRRLGRGGMAVVHEAVDSVTGQQVAIKTSLWPERRGGLKQEGMRLALARNPGLVRVHDYLDTAGEHLVLELLDGRTLADRMAQLGRRPMAIGATMRTLVMLAAATHNLHVRGWVHRDIKPNNVVITRDGRLVLIDLGIGGTDAECARDRSSVGSPSYMAPERWTGSTRVGKAHLGDIYSLGVIAFGLLTARLPLGKGPTAEIRQRHLELPVSAPRNLRADCPEALSDLVLQCLAKHPDDRPSASEVIEVIMDGIGSHVTHGEHVRTIADLERALEIE